MQPIYNHKNMEILEILSREERRMPKAFLYEENGSWFAYENSANLMRDLLKEDVHIKQIINRTYEICLERAEIEFSYLAKCSILQCSDSELIIDCSAVYLPEYKNSNCLDILKN